MLLYLVRGYYSYPSIMLVDSSPTVFELKRSFYFMDVFIFSAAGLVQIYKNKSLAVALLVLESASAGAGIIPAYLLACMHRLGRSGHGIPCSGKA